MLQEQLDGQLRLATLDPLQGKVFSVRKRDGRVVPFDETRIALALEAAFRADAGIGGGQSLSPAAQASALRVANTVVQAVVARSAK
jgi:transcriptional regulator NrdR family protein